MEVYSTDAKLIGIVMFRNILYDCARLRELIITYFATTENFT